MVHWNGKLMKDTNGSSADQGANVDRIAVAVSGYEVNKILGITKPLPGTGKAQASANFKLLSLWGIIDYTVGMCFVTITKNTGAQNNGCVLLEQQMGKQLLHFTCRHNVHKLIVAGMFSASFLTRKASNIPIFENFQAFWPNIDQHL